MSRNYKLFHCMTRPCCLRKRFSISGDPSPHGRTSPAKVLNGRCYRLLTPKKINGVIFDLDGTLIDTLELRVTAWKDAFSRFGINLSRDEIRPLIGLPGEYLASLYSDSPAEIEMEEEGNFRNYLGTIALFPDVKETFSQLTNDGIRISIVTSSRRALVNMLSLPDIPVITIDDVFAGKPNTEPYLKALKLMGLKPDEVIVVGDSENDMIPARKLGSFAVFIRHGSGRVSEIADYFIDEVGEVPGLIRLLMKKRIIRRK